VYGVNGLQAGFATASFTPVSPVPLAGYPTEIESPAFRDGPRTELSTGVHDPVSVQTLVLSDGSNAVGIVAADLLAVSHGFTWEVRDAVGANGDRLNDLVVTATHTHSGPYLPAPLLETNPYLSIDRDASVLEASVRDAFVRSVTTALDRLEPATLRIGHSRNARTPVNRRDDDGEVDPDVLALDVTTASGARAVLVNFACHPICLGANTAVVSADYPGVVRKRAAEALGDVTVLFVNGAAGDVNPRAIESRYDDEYAYLDAIGTEVARSTLEAVSAAKVVLGWPIVTDRRELQLPLTDPPDRARLKRARTELTGEIADLEAAGNHERAFERRWDRLYVDEQIAIRDAGIEAVPVTMQYVGIGSVGIVSLPGEPFVEHGLALKAPATKRSSAVAGYANEYPGYVPTADELASRDGGGETYGMNYEVRTCKLSRSAVEQYRETGLHLVARSGRS
jgi:hypothetical protein